VSKKLLLGILIIAAIVFLLMRTKPETPAAPTVVSSPSDTPSSGEDLTDSSSASESTRTFGGNPCTSDCSGHEAGYNWAEEHGIDDESECDTAGDTSNSPSFAEGCRDYVMENKTAGDKTDDDSNN
jgi:hypothetical protein